MYNFFFVQKFIIDTTWHADAMFKKVTTLSCTLFIYSHSCLLFVCYAWIFMSVMLLFVARTVWMLICLVDNDRVPVGSCRLWAATFYREKSIPVLEEMEKYEEFLVLLKKRVIVRGEHTIFMLGLYCFTTAHNFGGTYSCPCPYYLYS